MQREIIMEKTAIDEKGVAQFEIARPPRSALTITIISRVVLLGICLFGLYAGV